MVFKLIRSNPHRHFAIKEKGEKERRWREKITHDAASVISQKAKESTQCTWNYSLIKSISLQTCILHLQYLPSLTMI